MGGGSGGKWRKAVKFRCFWSSCELCFGLGFGCGGEEGMKRYGIFHYLMGN